MNDAGRRRVRRPASISFIGSPMQGAIARAASS
jgi:hypothetical protein